MLGIKSRRFTAGTDYSFRQDVDFVKWKPKHPQVILTHFAPMKLKCARPLTPAWLEQFSSIFKLSRSTQIN